MRGLLLAGGTGARLYPLTKVTNKHLLPIYNEPMIYYPLKTLISCGVEDILIVSGKEHCGHMLSLLGSGRQFNVNLSYEIQDEALGIAHAISLAEDFADDEDLAVILGDNIYEHAPNAKDFAGGAKIFLKKTSDAQRFGVAEIKDNKIVSIEEKPEKPKTDLAVTGFYLYDSQVFDIIRDLKPSDRGEYEISDVNTAYIEKNQMRYELIEGFWSDTGTFETIYRASSHIRDKVTQKP